MEIFDASLFVVGAAREPELVDLWTRASDGEGDDLARLADREGSVGLIERAVDPALTRTSILALAYADGYAGLPFLAATAGGENESLALLAAESLVEIAARRRRAIDPEDALEIREGCDHALRVAKNGEKPRRLRVLLVRALRMFADADYVKTTDLPTDVDAR